MKIINSITFILSFALICFSLLSFADVVSLRGHNPLDEEAKIPTLKRWQHDREPIARNYLQQPPIIPHKIHRYTIDRRSNKCLTCHSWRSYKESGATKISLTHFRDRDGNELSSVAPRRYFCTQCHVPQVEAPPLIENQFTPVDSLTQE